MFKMKSILICGIILAIKLSICAAITIQIEAYIPSGLRACIRDESGIQKFEFYGNSTFHSIMFGGVGVLDNRKWCFLDTNIVIKNQEEIHYFGNVIKHGVFETTNKLTKTFQGKDFVDISGVYLPSMSNTSASGCGTPSCIFEPRRRKPTPAPSYSSITTTSESKHEDTLLTSDDKTRATINEKFDVSIRKNDDSNEKNDDKNKCNNVSCTANQTASADMLKTCHEKYTSLQIVVNQLHQDQISKLSNYKELETNLVKTTKNLETKTFLLKETFRIISELNVAKSNKLILAGKIVTSDYIAILRNIIEYYLEIMPDRYKLIKIRREDDQVFFELEDYKQKLSIYLRSKLKPHSNFQILDFDAPGSGL